jgi:hypothetical protein
MTRTEKNNAKFDNMTPAEKRVAMAKDALKWIEAGALVPTKGVYVNTIGLDIFHKANGPDAFSEDGSRKQARDVVLGACIVCAKGALLVAKAVRFNNVTVRDLADYSDDQLTDYFTPVQIDFMELAFENRLEPWFTTYRDDKDRLVAILQNVIRNKGEFKYSEVTAPK